jgi:hypothetical protein
LEECFVGWIDDVAAYLVTAGYSNIYSQNFDSMAANGIALIEAPGKTEKYTLKRSMVLGLPELDIRVRHSDDITAKETATAIHTLLNGKSGIIGSTNFKKIKASQDPYFLYQDDNDHFIYVANFQLQINR